MARARRAVNTAVEREVVSIPLAEIKQIENSRLVYDEHSIAELMVSLKQSGLLQPIGVRPSDEGYELIFGNRRFLAAQKLGWRTIEAFIVNDVSDEELIVLNAVENMQRESVPPTEQGRLFSVLINDMGLTPEQVAARVGVSTSSVRNCLNLFSVLPSEENVNVRASKYGKRKVNGSGDVSATAAFGVANVVKRFNLSPQDRLALFRFAGKKGVIHAQVKLVGYFLNEGLTIEEATEKAESYCMVNVVVALPRASVAKLEEKEGESIYRILKKRVSEMKDLKGATAPFPSHRKAKGNVGRATRYFPR